MPEPSLRIKELLALLPAGVQLVAVSKLHPAQAIRSAYSAGQRRFGESRADELAAKAAELPSDIEWHFIGHLQTNKVRRVLPVISMIESIDSERLLRAVSAEASRLGRTVRILMQVHVAAEQTKTGFLPSELEAAARLALTLPGIEVAGVMGMATTTDDQARIGADFDAIAALGSRLRAIVPGATHVSMGMSGDWPLAAARGATLVRIGSAIFGPRS